MFAFPCFGRSLGVLLLLFAAGAFTGVAGQVEEVVIQGPAGLPLPRDVMPPADVPPAGTAVMSGAVVSADLGRPVRRAVVRLSSTTPRPPYTVVADDAGRFTFSGVAAGEYLLSATKPGYLESIFGQKQPGSGRPGTPISVGNGQRVERLSLPIARGGVLAGSVADDGGEPAFGTEVRAYKYVWQRGARTLSLAGSDTADDRGSFRIGALPPGEYLVIASPAASGNRENMVLAGPFLGGIAMAKLAEPAAATASNPANATGYAPVFFPGTTSSSAATAVTIGVSEEREGLGMQLPLVPMTRVTGSIASDGGAVMGTMVRLTDLDMPVPGFGIRVTGTGPDGRFTFEDVAPGRYRVEAQTGPQNRIVVEEGPIGAKVTMQFTEAAREGGAGPGSIAAQARRTETRWAAEEITASGGTVSVALVLEPGVTVSGRLAFDGTGQPPADLSVFRVTLTSADPIDPGISTSIAQAGADGGFTINGVAPGTFRVTLLSPTPWRPKSFETGGRDALDFLLNVEAREPIDGAVFTLTSRPSMLSGTLVDASSKPATGFTIVLFPEDPAFWTPGSRRIQAARPSTTGRFTFGNLPAGAYRLVAVDDLEDGQWADPAVLRQLAAGSMAVTLGDGESKTQDVRVAR